MASSRGSRVPVVERFILGEVTYGTQPFSLDSVAFSAIKQAVYRKLVLPIDQSETDRARRPIN